MRLIVFSDLDGTLLDHETYAFDAASTVLARLRMMDVPVVLATSKTAAEVVVLHNAMALGDAPAIVENGAGVWRPDAGPKSSEDYDRLCAILDALPESLRAPFRGFAAMSAEEVAGATGLSVAAAALAKLRAHSEPGLWTGDADGREAFLRALQAEGIAARQGGRFLTLSFGRTKADAMREIAQEFGADTTIALGDAPNDVEMLQAADHGVIVRNDHGAGIPPLPEEARGGIRRTQGQGPAGWAEAMTDLLNALSG